MHLKIKGSITILSVIVLFTGSFLIQCARPGTPSGGPKDSTPPEVLSEIPPNRSVHFNSPRVTISFNEFVQLKDPAKEIFISPPVRVRPEFKAQGKKLLVIFKEELKKDATYTINFGNSIIDYTESNPLVNYEYVFSTGDHLDSLSISGKILNAFNHVAEPGIIAMVYQDDNDTIPLDSLPLRVQPKSASKSTKDGNFRINNLPAGKYKLFALEDFNNNYIYDLPTERIAFLDTLLTISHEEPYSTPNDSTDTIAYTTPSISLLAEDSYTIYLYSEIDSTQRLLGKKLIGSNLLQYIFRLPADSARIKPVGFETGRPDWYIKEYSKMKDTVNFWLKVGLPDTIRVAVSSCDTIVDTTRFILSRPVDEKLGKRKETAKGGLKVSSNIKAGALDLNKKPRLIFTKPVEDYDPDKIWLFSATDTIIPVFAFSDTLQRQGEIEYEWVSGNAYHLIIDDSAFCDLGGAYNDSTSIKFKVRSAEDYGILVMNVVLPETQGQFIIQLMNDKELILQEKIITNTGLVRFEYLMPGNYKLKAVFDKNANGKWDTGKYRKNALPEKVEYYQRVLSIRANWDLQEDWQINKK